MPSASARRCSNDDYITSTHRGHGHCLAKGADPKLMFAELLGKEVGYCKGKGGSMHIADPATGNLGANAIVGGSAGIATGAAFSSKYLKNGPRRGLLLRRRRARTGPALRGDEPRAAVEAAGHLRLREQRLQRVHALLRDRRRATSARAPQAFGIATRDGRRPGRPRRSTPWPRRTSSARARATARRSCSATPTAITATTSATSPAPTTGRRRKSRSGSRSAIRSRCTASG